MGNNTLKNTGETRRNRTFTLYTSIMLDDHNSYIREIFCTLFIHNKNADAGKFNSV